MRKIFASLKSVVAATLVAAMAFSVSCSYDDTAIKQDIQNVKDDLAALTERVNALETKLQSEVDSVKDLIDGKVVIVNVTTDEDGNQIIELSNGKTITVLAPQDSLYYRVTDGVLEVSADGENWVAVEQVAPEQVVADVIISEDGQSATIVLADGSEFTVVKAELIECDATRTQIYVAPDATKDIIFTVNDAVADINIMNQPLGWKASIELAPAAEDEVDPGMGVLAAGGQDFVLRITGPTADFVKAGYAEKEGFVSVHFNSANGGCKVARVLVNLAEITLNVDPSGNVTLTNSVATSQGVDEMGEPLYDFANFYIGIIDAEDYATYGDNVFVDTFDDWTYEYSANVASTQRTTGFQNVIDLQWYESGVCEKEVYNFTVDQLAQCFWPQYTFEIGKEYIIFVTTESEMAGYVEQPVLKSAVKETYKRVFVEAILDKENTTWNDATCEFTLAGYDYYVVGWVPTTQLEELVSYGMAADLDSALVFYIQNGGNIMNAGAVIADTEGSFLLSELANYSLTGWAPMLNADTEYYFYVYPFNAASEMELYTHQVVAENIRNYGTFRTKALVLGEFDPAAEFELVSIDENSISVNATFSEDVVTVAYNWYDAPFVDPEEAAAAILGDLYYTEYVTFDQETTYLAASNYEYYGLPVPIYLGVLAINANGEYVYVEGEFKAEEPEPAPQVAVTSFEYLGRYYDLDADDSTSGGDFVYVVTGEDGAEYEIGLYWAYAEADGTIKPGTYNYCYNAYDVMYSGWDGFIIKSDLYYYGSSWEVAEDGSFVLKIVDADGNAIADYVYSGSGQGGEEPEGFTPVRAEYDLMFDLYEYNGGDAEYAFWLYDAADNYVEVICKFGPHTDWNYEYSAALVVDGVRVDATSVQTQAPSDYNCEAGEKYFVVIATLSDGTELSIQDQLPAVEVNYLGEGSTYAPGGEVPVVEPTSYVFTSAVARASSGFGDFYIDFRNDAGDLLIVNFYNCQDADKNFLPEGTYYQAQSGGIYLGGYSSFTPFGGTVTNVTALDSVNVSVVDGNYKFEFNNFVLADDTQLNGVYEGAVEGMIIESEWVEPEPPVMEETTEWTIAYHSTSYGGKPGYSEHEIYFWVDASTYAIFDFTSVDSEGRVNAGTYDFTNGLNSFYCRTNEGTMTSATVVVTDGDDANSKNFEVTFVVDEYKPFHFTYTGSAMYPVE